MGTEFGDEVGVFLQAETLLGGLFTAWGVIQTLVLLGDLLLGGVILLFAWLRGGVPVVLPELWGGSLLLASAGAWLAFHLAEGPLDTSVEWAPKPM
jgi:hypothetical protein